MGLITKTVFKRWYPNNKEWFINKGYKFTKIKEEFEVRVEDLTNGNGSKVNVKCDGKDCKNPYLPPMQWANYFLKVHNDGKYYCQKCTRTLNKHTSEHKKSFKQWCIENNRQDILDRWDYDLNDKRPEDIIDTSRGKKNKGYWFKCDKNLGHKSELQHIQNFTHGQKSDIYCQQCKMVATTNPEILKYFANIKDALNHSHGSSKKILIKCPDCGYEKMMRISDLIVNGIACPRCGDGISYPEKFVFNMFQQLRIKYIPQLSKKDFEWCKEFKYDFYIPSLNSIVETHGAQHYEESHGNWKSLIIVQWNDEYKRRMAKLHGIKDDDYIVIDCRKSDMEWIKNNILKSKLAEVYDLSNINWIECGEFACKNMVKEVCNLWNNGLKNIIGIANKLKLNASTIRRYIKQGTKLKWCDYDSKEQQKINYQNQSIPVICINTNEIFDSLRDAFREYSISVTSILRCCKNIKQSAGKHPVTGVPLKWMYYDSYLKLTENEKIIYKNKKNIRNNCREVICITTDEIFESITKASKKYNIDRLQISKYCRGLAKSAGIHPITNEKMIWMYYSEYLKLLPVVIE